MTFKFLPGEILQGPIPTGNFRSTDSLPEISLATSSDKGPCYKQGK